MNNSFSTKFVALVAALISGPLLAAEDVPSSRVLGVGCHSGDGTCYVRLEDRTFGASLGCPISNTNEFRFDNGDTPVGRRNYASFLAAALSGRKVTVNLNGCSVQGWPKLAFYFIES